MSQSDDPFGKSQKTVIRPRPGGAPDSGFGSSPFGDPPPSGFGGAPRQPPPGQATVIAPRPVQGPASNSPFGGYSGGPAPAQPGIEDWMSGAPSAPRPAPPPMPARRKIPLNVAINAGDSEFVKATNPVVNAASPLLILLGRLRQMVVDVDAVPLMQHVARAISEFEKAVVAKGVSSEQARVAKYALCATADDIVQNLPGADKHVWLQYSMLAQFFGQRTSGVGFFEQVRSLTANPTVNYDLLELIHACLSLGFEGQYRAAGGDVELQRIRRDVYNTLRAVRSRADEDISPRWRGLALKARRLGDGIPVWAIASFLATALAGLYMLLRFLIGGEGDAAAATLVNLHPKAPVSIQRQSFEPLPLAEVDTTQLQRIRGVLGPEIEKGLVGVDAVGEFIVMRLSNVLLFESGRAEVKAEFAPLAERLAEALNKEPGYVGVTGHTDNVRPRPSSRFKSNFDLSVKRAEAVAEVIAITLADKSRMKVDGKGEDAPVADNSTPEGRALNRRVEIVIPREETLKP